MILSLREGGCPLMKLSKDVTGTVPVTEKILAPSEQDIYHSNRTTTNHLQIFSKARHKISVVPISISDGLFTQPKDLVHFPS